MKTPREILFERHQAIAPKLDAIRRKIVWEGRRAAVPTFRVAGTATLPMLIWREVFWPWRRVWAGLAAVWLVILAGNLSLREPSPAITARSAAPSQEAIDWFRDQQKILAELLADHSAPRDAERQKLLSPKPRTERFEVITV